MKFSKTLKYNTLSEWTSYYMDYVGLKRIITRLQKAQEYARSKERQQNYQDGSQSSLNEATPLLRHEILRDSLKRSASASVLADLEHGTHLAHEQASSQIGFGDDVQISTLETEFFDYVEIELRKVEQFYLRMERELERITIELEGDAQRLMLSPVSRANLEDFLRALRKRYTEHYLELAELHTYANLNYTGFEKIMKKHDKYSGKISKDRIMALVDASKFGHPSRLEDLLRRVEREFAGLFCSGMVNEAVQELRGALEELVIWERNTVWKDMLLEERRVHVMRTKKKGQETSADADHILKPLPLAVAILMFVFILAFPSAITNLLPTHHHFTSAEIGAAQRCLALVALVSTLWATEAVPLYVTSFAIFPLSVLLRVFINNDGSGTAATAIQAASLALDAMAASVLMLIIGGYSLAGALSKLAIDRAVAIYMMSQVRSTTQLLLMVMGLSVFLSMWISNVAAPVLLNSVVVTILRGVPASSLPLVRATLLGISVACNIGGMASPVSSPQNAVAMAVLSSYHEIGFIEWIGTALPLCVLLVVICHLVLTAWFRPGHYGLPLIPKHQDRFDARHRVVIGTMIISVLLWCFKPALGIFGSEGIIACIPVVILFGTGILTKEDFNSLPWNVIYLVAGGICLGKAVKSSQLLYIVVGAVESILDGVNLWTMFFCFGVLTLIVSSIVSHTVSSIILIPVVAEVGQRLGHPRLLVMGCAIACSGAMSLPISSFPNMACVSVENELGRPYITNSLLMKVGIVMTLIAGGVIFTVGFAVMKSVGF